MRSDIVIKTVPFEVLETKEIQENGVDYGIVRGYASTYGNVDRGNDVVLPGAFTASLAHYSQNNRPIKMYFNHNNMDLIGGFPIEKIRDDANGLYVEGHINLEVQKGKEAYALAKQGVMRDFSIGYTIDDYDLDGNVRELKQVTLWEISMVGEPMNTRAEILDVKAAVPYQDLPIADEDTEWDSGAAIKRVREFTDSRDKPSDDYKKAFMWYDADKAENFTSYKLPYADVIDGELKAVPKAIFSIAGTLRGARGGVDVPQPYRKKIINNLNKYYEKTGMTSPFNGKYFTLSDVKGLSDKRDFEKVLRDSGMFSRKASVFISSLIKQSESAETNEILNSEELKKLMSYINNNNQKVTL